MAVDQTSTLSNSLRTQYVEDYIRGGMRRRFYDIIAQPIDERSEAAGKAQTMADLKKSGTVQVEFISDMAVGTTPLSEVQDIVPQILADATATVTTDMFGDAIQTSQKAMIQRYTNYGASRSEKVGLNMMEVVDFKAQEQALAGSLYYRYIARAKLDAGTTAHRASNSIFSNVAARLSHFNCPGWEGESQPTSWVALTDHFVMNDIVTSGNVVNVAEYQNGSIVLQNELGRLNSFKLVPSGWAKILYGAGTLASTVNTTLSSAAARLDKTIVLGSTTNVAAGQWLNVITGAETSTTFYPENERVKVDSISGTTVTIVGEGSNGGLRFAHAAGATVTDKDSVHLITFGGPSSLAKVYAPEIGEFGEMVGPLKQGLAHQWDSLAWKWYGGYGLLSENWLYRAEVSVSEEA